MNVKVRMPKLGKKLRTKKYWRKELMMTIIATSISIVLTSFVHRSVRLDVRITWSDHAFHVYCA